MTNWQRLERERMRAADALFAEGESNEVKVATMKLFMWVDRHDPDMVQLGTDRTIGNGYLCWGQMHIDGIGETFGENVKKIFVESAKGSDPPVHCLTVDESVIFVDGESVIG